MNYIFKNKNLAFLFFAIFYIVCLSCRYTIREIGFANLSDVNHRLYVYGEKLPVSEKNRFTKSLETSNTTAIFVETNKMNDPERAYFKKYKTDDSNFAVLVSSSGHNFRVGYSSVDDLINLFNTNTYQQLHKYLISNFAVVLVGGDTSNVQIREQVKSQISEFSKIQQQLPKAIKEGAIYLELDFRNDVLLKKYLGFQENLFKTVVLYGRGRILAEPIGVKEVEDSLILKYLNVIGSDCECGLSKSWMVGNCVPLLWNAKAKSTLYKKLGFDVEDPMVKSEMSQIISKQRDSEITLDNVDLFQPNEINLEDDEFEEKREYSTEEILFFTIFFVLLISLILSWLVFRVRK
jgi:hypothetical protein